MIITAEKSWADLFRIVSADGASEDDRKYMWRQILKRYSEPHRKYHNMTHIDKCFSGCHFLFENYRIYSLELAILFHDIIYKPRKDDNEFQSAEFLREFMNVGSNNQIVNAACGIIKRTNYTKKYVSKNIIDQCMHDIDFAIFAESDDYVTYETNIRKEYDFVDDETYYKHRAKFLIGILEKKQIFYTPQYYDLYERLARENILWTLGRIITK